MRHKIIAILIYFICSSFTFTDTPQQFKDALNKLYPDATKVDWAQSWNYYTATFIKNTYQTKVWMNNQAQWIMTVIDLQTADALPINVYNAFTFSEYSQWNVLNIVEVVFPQYNNQYIINVNQDNSITTDQLFYSPSGRLLNVRNVTYVPHEITPQIYGFQLH